MMTGNEIGAGHAVLTVNGKTVEVPVTVLTVADLVAHLGLADRRIAVERNRAIVKREAWALTRLEPGDAIEVLQFVGGG